MYAKAKKDPIQRKFKIHKANIYYSERDPIQGSKLYLPSISSLQHLQFSLRTEASRPEPLYVYRDPYQYVQEILSKLRMDGRYKENHQHSTFINGFWNQKVSNEKLLKGTKSIRNQMHADIDTTVYCVMRELYRQMMNLIW